MAIGRNYGAARVAGFVYFGEEIESACFKLVNKQVISVLFSLILPTLYISLIASYTSLANSGVGS